MNPTFNYVLSVNLRHVHLQIEKMEKKFISYLLLSIIVASCSLNKKTPEELAFIDVSKKYPAKEISLTDIADVTYVYLNSKSDDFLFKGGISYVTRNTIVVIDRSSHSILFFSKDGNSKSRFNRRGQGPEEYTDAASVMYDETKDDVYISPDLSDHVMVYSSSGDFKRKITLPQVNINGQMALFDNQSILVYDNTKLWHATVRDNFTEKVGDSTFFLISSTDGTVLEYIHLPNKNIDLGYKDLEGVFVGQVSYGRVRRCSDGLFLYNPETDTVFHYSQNKSLTPYFHKKPLLGKYSPMSVMDICMDAGGFQFISIYPYLKTGKSPSPKYYMRDKKTGEIFRLKITIPGYQGIDFFVNPRLYNYYEKGYHFELDVVNLEEAYNENKLSGKLKELAALLIEEEEANNVFVLVDFHD